MKRTMNNGTMIAAAVLCTALGFGLAGGWAVAADTAPATTPAADAHAQALDHYSKARDLYQKEKFAEANAENNAALALDPSFVEAKSLKRLLAAKLGINTGTGENPAETEPSGPEVPAAKIKLLSPEAISKIRFMELGDKEPGVRGSIPAKTIEDFWNDYVKKEYNSPTREDHEKFISPNNISGQIYKIRESRDAKYLEKVKITSDPADMVAFRTTIQPYVLQNCATAACHGGGRATDFRLITKHGGLPSIEETYTNFYIMSSYVAKDGGRVINRDDPVKSLFVQYGLPKEVAKLPHPGNLKELRPLFPDENDSRYKSLVGWVRTLAFPLPEYGFTYEFATTRPAVAPTK